MSRQNRRQAELAREQAFARAQTELASTRADLDQARAEHVALREQVNGLRTHLAKVDGETGGMREWLRITSERVDAVAAVREGLQRHGEEIAELKRRVPDDVPLYGDETLTLERFDAGLGGEVVGFRDGASDPSGAGYYVGFQDFFRGSEELIRERQRAYLPLLEGRAPVLDVGCGRGEMLELLGAHGIEAAGIDLDRGMVEHCRAKGLERVEVADAAGYLEAVDRGSLGAVFAAQVIEHLPYSELTRFLRAARTSLAAGGRLIVETVNPHAPQARKHFWIDPTHQHPLFPEVVIALCRLTGFERGFIWYPQGSGDPDRDRVEQMDYAVVAEVG